MKLYSRISMLVLVSVMTACTPTVNPPQTPARPTVQEDTKAINELRDEFLAAWRAGDAERVANLYANDAILLPQNSPAIIGRSAIVTFNKNLFDQVKPNNFELSSEEVQIIGDWAFDRGTYALMITPKAGGQPISDQGKYLVLLQRQPGVSWRVARDIDNSSNPLPQAAPSTKPKS